MRLILSLFLVLMLNLINENDPLPGEVDDDATNLTCTETQITNIEIKTRFKNIENETVEQVLKCSFFCSFVLLFAHSFIHLFVHSFIHSFIHAFIHSFTH